MTAMETTTWERIHQFNPDDPNASFQFSHRLARENGWSRTYALRVIDEYKKFLFLCCVCKEGVTPSDAVDQAWHLHLTFTQSYWVDLCRNTLGRELHHNPTQGGQKEAQKFNHFYSSSHELYKKYFGTEPPADIWPNHQKRFSEIHFQRINLSQFWVIRKPGFQKRLFLRSVVLCLCLLIFVQAIDFPSVMVIVVLGGMLIYRISRRNGNDIDNDSGGYGGGINGCSTTSGCGGHHGSHGGHDNSGCSSGCGSGCSGCSSGCSGCGGH